ncbi:Hypothetical predicted protein, partial [Podarcis lilfordi]
RPRGRLGLQSSIHFITRGPGQIEIQGQIYKEITEKKKKKKKLIFSKHFSITNRTSPRPPHLAFFTIKFFSKL